MGDSLMLVIGGLIILGIFLLGANSLLLDNTTLAQQNEALLTAISLAQSVVEEAKTKAFDQNVLSGMPCSRDSLTSVSLLGPDGSSDTVPFPDTLSVLGFHSTSRFNDVDDYNGYTRRVNTPRGGPFDITTNVEYVSEVAPDLSLSTTSYCKKMTVRVTGPQLANPLSIQYIFAY
jgi:hypothetical protein